LLGIHMSPLFLWIYFLVLVDFSIF